MENKKELTKSLSGLLDMLPNNLLNEEEKKKVDEIRGMIEKIDKQIDKEESKKQDSNENIGSEGSKK